MSAETEAGEFLHGKQLALRLCDVAGGAKVRCATAFWSAPGVSRLFPQGLPSDAKIVCDIAMGSTSAKALRALGAPGDSRIKHWPYLHAKVILSDLGLVVSSANASKAALGASGKGRNIETGTFHVAGSATWKRARSWFRALYRDARDIGQAEINWAETVYAPPRVPPLPSPPKPDSLLALVRAAPGKFDRVGFVFVSRASDDEEVDLARNAAISANPAEAEHIEQLHRRGFFTGWKKRKIEDWPNRFIEFWQPRNALYLYPCRLEVKVPDARAVLSVRDREGLQREIGIPLPSFSKAAKSDATIARLLHGDNGELIVGGYALAARLAKLEGEHPAAFTA